MTIVVSADRRYREVEMGVLDEGKMADLARALSP
jgi:hypothetical protein